MMHAELHNNNQGISKLYDVNTPGGIKCVETWRARARTHATTSFALPLT